MASEIELKLTTDRTSLALAREHPAVIALLQGPAQTTEDVSTYYDTRDRELRDAGVSLRMRRSGQRWVQTAKGSGERLGALHRRPEYEWSMPGSRIDAGKLSTTPWHTLFAATTGRLRPVFVTDVDRTTLPLTFADGTRAALCLDSGEIRAGRRRAPLSEIEIELVEGEPGALYELALTLAADLPVAVAQASKAERGYALANPSPFKPVRARKLSIAAEASVGHALARVGGDCLVQIGANTPWVASKGGEFVHQARVGARRLRSLLQIVAGLPGAEAIAPLVHELQWLSTSLGATRDWDVFAGETLASVAKTLRQPQARRDVGALRGYVTRARGFEFAGAGAADAAASPRVQRMLLAFGALFAAMESPTADAALRAPAKSLAKDILERRAKRLGKRGAHLQRVSPAERHEARIAAKKLRYVAELFAPVFSNARAKSYLDGLATLQTKLGYLNDLATGEQLLDQIEQRTRAQRVVHGAGIVRGWLSGAEAAGVAEAAQAWRKFAKLKPFWR
jgi:triphosphatase